MRKIELEAWVHRILDAAEKGQPNEDSHVEFKSEWLTDHLDAARKLAGLANAAHGEPVLWVIGVAKDGQVSGAPHEELADWWPQISKHFDELPPQLLLDVNVQRDERTVVALLFSTDRAPFVVKVAQGKGGIDREVPWREGTRTRSARRQDIVRAFGPTVRMPDVEWLWADFAPIGTYLDGKNRAVWQWKLRAELFVTPRGEAVYLVVHRTSAAAKPSREGEMVPRLGTVEALSDIVAQTGAMPVLEPRVVALEFRANTPEPWTAPELAYDYDVTLTLGFASIEKPRMLSARLLFARDAAGDPIWVTR